MIGSRRLLAAPLLAGAMLLTSFAWPSQVSVISPADGATARLPVGAGVAEHFYVQGFHVLATATKGDSRASGAVGFWAYPAVSADMTPTIGAASGYNLTAAGRNPSTRGDDRPQVVLSLR